MLLSQVKLGTPSLWMKTKDSYRMIDYLLASNLREFYMIHSDFGFSKFVNKQWLPILVDKFDPEDGNTVQAVTYDLNLAYNYLKQENLLHRSTLIHNVINNVDMFVMQYGNLIASSLRNYRESFYEDDVNSFPLQHVIFSHQDCPETHKSLFTHVESSPMSLDEIKSILFHFNSVSDGMLVNEKDVEDIAKAGSGLSEFEFINLSLLSIIDKKKINPEYIYQSKMKNIKQNGILEIIKPTNSFDKIGGLDLAKDIVAKIVWLWNNPQKAKEYGVQPIRRMLMVGVPGTGKSAICEATAKELNLDLARTGVSQVMNSFVGQSESNMRAVFQQIKVMAPLCVWIDEFGRDLSGGASSSYVDGGTTDRVHGEFLTGLQELPENVFLICAANQLENLRPEMLRADRFDKIMFVGLPSFEERKEIFKIYLSDIQTDYEYDYDKLSEATWGYTGAEIKALIKETKFNIVSSQVRSINDEDIINQSYSMRNILWNKNKEMIKDLYRSALQQWDFASSSQFDEAESIISGNYGKMRSTTKSKGNW